MAMISPYPAATMMSGNPNLRNGSRTGLRTRTEKRPGREAGALPFLTGGSRA